MKDFSKIVKPKLVKAVLWGGLLVIIIVALNYFESLLKPFFIAFFIWFLIKELRLGLNKIRIKGKRLPKVANSILAFLIIILFTVFLIEIISNNVRQISDNIPTYESKFDSAFDKINEGIREAQLMEKLESWFKDLDFASIFGSFANKLTNFVGNSLIVLIYLIFMLLEEYAYNKKVNKLFPDKAEKYQKIKRVIQSINDSVKSYFISKTLVSLILGVACYFILLLFNIDYPALWAFLIFILNYIPYVGSFFATLFPSLLAIVQFGEFKYFLYVFGAIQVVQIIMANVVEPKLMGKSLNLSPLTVLFSLALWGYIWGIIGMILAIPITGILTIILAQFPESKYLAIILSEKGEV